MPTFVMQKDNQKMPNPKITEDTLNVEITRDNF